MTGAVQPRRSLRMASAALGGLLVLAAPAMAADAPPAGQADISGVFGPTPRAPGPRDPAPLRPEAKAILDARVASQITATPWADSGSQCLPTGMPSAALTPPGNYVFQILQSPSQVTILYEALGMVRRIRLDRGHPADIDPSFMGDSIGRWEGDTLVVDTIGLNDRHTIDKPGTPMSTQMHIVERIRRISPTQVENVVTLDDPKVLTRPWTQRVVYTQQPPTVEIIEYVCENNRTVIEDGNMAKFTK